ncbi:Fc receptor-like protein 5 [Mantella aurantiaca]
MLTLHALFQLCRDVHMPPGSVGPAHSNMPSPWHALPYPLKKSLGHSEHSGFQVWMNRLADLYLNIADDLLKEYSTFTLQKEFALSLVNNGEYRKEESRTGKMLYIERYVASWKLSHNAQQPPLQANHIVILSRFKHLISSPDHYFHQTFVQRPIVMLRGIFMDNQGHAARPLVTFHPNWAKVFTGESMTMTCYISSAHQNQRFFWYKDNEKLAVNDQTYTISNTKTGDTGNYQCRITSKEVSDISRLEVIYGYLILQVPLLVYEGDEVLMRCYSWPGYSVRRTMFLKSNTVIRPLTADTNLIIHNVKKDAAGKYKCVKKSEYSSDTSYTDESSLYVKDLFSSPELIPTPYQVTEGAAMTLKCSTILNPLRQETELQYAFYKDGRYVQRFGLSNQYGVRSAQLEDIGDYSCEVKTSSSTVKKMGKAIHVHIQDLFKAIEIRFTPFPVVEGDHMIVTCQASLSSLKMKSALQFAFYRDGRNVQRFSLSDQHGDCCAKLGDSGNYSCEAKALNNVRKTSKELHVFIHELFPRPHITAILYPVEKGDPITLRCNTSLILLRQRTELQFAFYRDGQDIQGFSLSDQYEAYSAQLEDSGNYSCEVKASTSSIKKRSEQLNIQIQDAKDRRYEVMNITRLVVAVAVFAACCFIIFKYC